MNIKAKEKLKVSENLARMYNILPEFIKNTEIEQLKKDTIEIKTNILNAYAYVDKNEWDKVQGEVINAEKKMVKTMNDTSKKQDQRKFNINKSYILIEELKNSIPLQEKQIFYIKYKNIIEELNTLI